MHCCPDCEPECECDCHGQPYAESYDFSNCDPGTHKHSRTADGITYTVTHTYLPDAQPDPATLGRSEAHL